MGKSKAKRLREKLVREGKRNPEANRSPYAFTDMQTRRTKTRKDHLYQFKHRKNHSSHYGDDGSFYFLI